MSNNENYPYVNNVMFITIYSELADILKISKSCLNHRLRKIIEIADEL